MALGQPTLTVTINAVAKVLNRIKDDGSTSEYFLRGTLDEFTAKIRHSRYTDSRGVEIDRHNVELVQTVFPVAPATKTTVRKAYTVFENERYEDATAALNFDNGFVAVLSSAHNAELINWIS
jgi:hypothetical protein